MSQVRYLTEKQILLVHSLIIDKTGGAHGVRDHHAILALVNLPKQKFSGKELYSGIFIKAAVYIRNIIMSHPFIDGNKRTAMTSAGVFLENNNFKFIAKEGDIEKFALEIIAKKYNIKTISAWIKKHSKKIK